MGLLDFLKKKPAQKQTEEKTADTGPQKFSMSKSKKEEETDEEVSSEVCALCNAAGADKKWAGQWWHKRCLRSSRKMARGMV